MNEQEMTTYIEQCSETFASRSTRLRHDRGWTRPEAALNLGLSTSAVRSYEKEGVQPTLNSIIRYSVVFDVSVDWLLGQTDLRRLPSKETLSQIQGQCLEFGCAIQSLQSDLSQRDGE